jgi:hypothetical protein
MKQTQKSCIGLGLLSITINIFSMSGSDSENGEKPLLDRPATTLKIDVSSPGPVKSSPRKKASSQPQRGYKDKQMSSPHILDIFDIQPATLVRNPFPVNDVSPKFDDTFNSGFNGMAIPVLSPTPSNSPRHNTRQDPFAQLAKSRVASDSPRSVTNAVEQKKFAEGYSSPLLSPSPTLFKRSPESHGSNGSFHRSKSSPNLHRQLKNEMAFPKTPRTDKLAKMVALLDQQHIVLYKIKDTIDLQGHMNRQYLREIYQLNRRQLQVQEKTNKLLTRLFQQQHSKKAAKKNAVPLKVPKPVPIINPQFIEQVALEHCQGFQPLSTSQPESNDGKK